MYPIIHILLFGLRFMPTLLFSESLVCKDDDASHKISLLLDDTMLNRPDEQKVLNISDTFENHYFKTQIEYNKCVELLSKN